MADTDLSAGADPMSIWGTQPAPPPAPALPGTAPSPRALQSALQSTDFSGTGAPNMTTIPGAGIQPGQAPASPEQTQLDIAGRTSDRITQSEDTLLAGLQASKATEEGAFKAHEALVGREVPKQTQSMEDLAAFADKQYRAAEAYKEQAANFQEKQAQQLMTDDQRLMDYANKTPTRQAAYANAMHVTPLLSILAAIGGAASRASALSLLGATAGVVQGVNEGAENKFTDAVNQWQSHYNALKDHMSNVQEAYKLYQEAYQGRADGRELAAEHARIVTGDRLSASQLKITSSANLLDEQGKILDRTDKNLLAWQRIEEARALRQGGLDQQSEMTEWMMAQQVYRGGKMLDVVGGRGKYNMPMQMRVWGKAQQIFAQEHANDTGADGKPLYQGPNDPRLAQAAGDWLFAQRSNNAAFQAGQQAAGRQLANMEGAARSMERLMPLQQQLAEKVLAKYGKFTPYNKLKLDFGLRTSDKDVNAFVMNHEALTSDWMTLSNRGRQGTGEERDRKFQKFNEATDFGAYMTEMRTAQFEAAASRAGYEEATQRQSYDPSLSRVPLTLAPQYDPSYVTNPPAGAPGGGGAPTISTREQYEAFKKSAGVGAQFIGADGKPYTVQ